MKRQFTVAKVKSGVLRGYFPYGYELDQVTKREQVPQHHSTI